MRDSRLLLDRLYLIPLHVLTLLKVSQWSAPRKSGSSLICQRANARRVSRTQITYFIDHHVQVTGPGLWIDLVSSTRQFPSSAALSQVYWMVCCAENVANLRTYSAKFVHCSQEMRTGRLCRLQQSAGACILSCRSPTLSPFFILVGLCTFWFIVFSCKEAALDVCLSVCLCVRPLPSWNLKWLCKVREMYRG